MLIGTYIATTPNTDHNQYVRGNYVYQANYGAGLRILKLDDVAKVTVIGAMESIDEAAALLREIDPPFDGPDVVALGIHEHL